MALKKLFLFGAAFLALGAVSTEGYASQTPTPTTSANGKTQFSQPAQKGECPENVQRVINAADQHYRLGVDHFNNGRYELARNEFDRAVDLLLQAEPEVRQNSYFHTYYLELVDRIHKHQIIAQQQGSEGFTQQPLELSPLDELAKIDLDAEGVPRTGTVDLSGLGIQFTTNTAMIEPAVIQFINFFTQGKGRITMETGLRRSGRFRAMVERIFKEEGVPLDIIWLAQVESVWIPHALSSAAAKGIWQFIPSTGERFGLSQDAWIDERVSPEKSTRAAARYLKFLNEFFAGDWLLAMGAYNCGEHRVDRAIGRCGYADFWALYNRNLLPMETRNYVPAILAVMVIAKNPEKYGFNVQPEEPWDHDTFDLQAQIDLRVVSSLLNIPYETIRDLNPELKRGITPPSGYTLRLPKNSREQFEVAFNALTPDQYLSRPLSLNTELAASGRGSHYKTRYVKHVTRAGETLNAVAARYGISSNELARRNGLSESTQLRRGQRLVVPIQVSSGRVRYKVKNATAKSVYKGRTIKSKRRSR
ncbi:MAG: transglycosylase SLT domain-containing protein [Acidobacteriota bacterium]